MSAATPESDTTGPDGQGSLYLYLTPGMGNLRSEALHTSPIWPSELYPATTTSLFLVNHEECWVYSSVHRRRKDCVAAVNLEATIREADLFTKNREHIHI